VEEGACSVLSSHRPGASILELCLSPIIDIWKLQHAVELEQWDRESKGEVAKDLAKRHQREQE
jgi:hypothetical protein